MRLRRGDRRRHRNPGLRPGAGAGGPAPRSARALIAALALCGCTAPAPHEAPRTLFGGARPAILQVPVAYDGTRAMPLLVVLHGYTSSGLRQQRYFDADSLVNAAGVFVIAPNGTEDERGNRFWNATDACCDLYGAGVDDVAYVKELIADIRHDYRIDASRIYLWGHSNGGFMAHRMACEDADEIAAIVALAGATWADASKCAPSAAVSVLDIHGDADRTIAHDGGDISDNAYPSEAVTLDRWSRTDACGSDATEDPKPLDLDNSLDGAETVVSRWTGCATGAGVELWTIRGGGHVPNLREGFAETVWAWLAAHPKS